MFKECHANLVPTVKHSIQSSSLAKLSKHRESMQSYKEEIKPSDINQEFLNIELKNQLIFVTCDCQGFVAEIMCLYQKEHLLWDFKNYWES